MPGITRFPTKVSGPVTPVNHSGIHFLASLLISINQDVDMTYHL